MKAELAQVSAAGTLPFGETGVTLAKLDPGRDPHAVQAAGQTSEKLRAEPAKASRGGDVLIGDSGRTLPQSWRLGFVHGLREVPSWSFATD